MMKRRNLALALVLIGLFLAAGRVYFRNYARQKPFAVILFVTEGLTPARLAAARQYAGGSDARLAMEYFPRVGLLRAAGADYAVPDTAAAATALATGRLANLRAVGIDAEGREPVTLPDHALSAGREEEPEEHEGAREGEALTLAAGQVARSCAHASVEAAGNGAHDVVERERNHRTRPAPWSTAAAPTRPCGCGAPPASSTGRSMSAQTPMSVRRSAPPASAWRPPSAAIRSASCPRPPSRRLSIPTPRSCRLMPTPMSAIGPCTCSRGPALRASDSGGYSHLESRSRNPRHAKPNRLVTRSAKASEAVIPGDSIPYIAT